MCSISVRWSHVTFMYELSLRFLPSVVANHSNLFQFFLGIPSPLFQKFASDLCVLWKLLIWQKHLWCTHSSPERLKVQPAVRLYSLSGFTSCLCSLPLNNDNNEKKKKCELTKSKSFQHNILLPGWCSSEVMQQRFGDWIIAQLTFVGLADRPQYQLVWPVWFVELIMSLAELSVFPVGGSSRQGWGNAEASSPASLLRHGALRVDPLHW